jgi:hypothetical protein
VQLLVCDLCDGPIPTAEPVLFATQESGCGPYPGQCGWYTATSHVDPCGAGFLASSYGGVDYRPRECRGCERVMWLRPRGRRQHCTDACRQADYRRRRDLGNAALARNEVLYRDELYWLTQPGQVVAS